jgi:cobyrinic acid a,c-diamide synthase
LEGLSANNSLLADIRRALKAGMPAYAECGGLMYLARSIQWRGERRDMVNFIAADAVVGERPQGRGYMLLEESGNSPWPQAPDTGSIPVHEFHYARLENPGKEQAFAYRVLRGTGIDGNHDGLVTNNLLAGFGHHRNTKKNPWVERFVAFVRDTSK